MLLRNGTLPTVWIPPAECGGSGSDREHIRACHFEQAEDRLAAIMATNAEADLLKTIPYVGRVPSMAMALEIGDVNRFQGSAHWWRENQAGAGLRKRQPLSEMGFC